MAVSLCLLAAGCGSFAPLAGSCALPRPAHVVIAIEENHGYSQIIGNPDAPYINRLAREGANFTSSFAVTHPSQPNYIALFCGSTLGVLDDQPRPHEMFTMPNLGSKLLAAGLTFAGYSDGLPEVGFDGKSAGDDENGTYQRKHNPWVNWQDDTVPLPPNKLPPGVNLPFTSFPASFDSLPTVSIVVPNQKHDMHDGSVAEADAWLEQNLGAYVEWARTHNSLLILTFDEDMGLEFNRIVTIFHGPMIAPGNHADVITHLNVLRTVEMMYALPADGEAPWFGPPACGVWQSVP